MAPTKIIAIGRNYAAHAAELGNEVPSTPISFFKPPSCLLASGQPLALPRGYERVDMEAELVLVIGARARSVRAEDAWAHVAGYLMGNDVSCRDLQRADKLWTRAKGFDGFGPVSAFARLVPPGWVLPADLEVHGFLDDERVQAGSVAQMIFSIPTLIEHLSACMTLEPGDMIFTGTPAGVSALEPGKVTRVALGGREDFHLAPVVTPVV
nr:fumarylacetoacetate hydrolase family protein [Pseudenhygromyxa sp. WMMC2535]